MRITKFISRLIFNGKGQPTIEVEVGTHEFSVTSSVPCAASRSRYEKPDVFGNKKAVIQGKTLNLSVENLNRIVAPELIGRNPVDQETIDDILLEINDSVSTNSFALGAMALAATSQAVAKLGALVSNLPLYKYIRILHDLSPFARVKLGGDYTLPLPVITVYRSITHEMRNKLPVQEVMVYPKGYFIPSRDLVHIFDFVQRIRLDDHKASLKTFLQELRNFIKSHGMRLSIGIDMAASSLFDAEHQIYVIPNLVKYGTSFKGGAHELVKVYLKYFSEIIDFFEDPFAEDEYGSWKELYDALDTDKEYVTKEIVSDDLTATNINRLEKIAVLELANNVVIKPSQIGTVTDVVNFAALANSHGFGITGSYRYGETGDTFIVDLSVGVGAHYIRVGYFNGSEYISKVNRLLRIESYIE